MNPVSWTLSSTNPITFEKFPRLATELHIKFWKYATDGPHIIRFDIRRTPDTKRRIRVREGDRLHYARGVNIIFPYGYKCTIEMAHFGVHGACTESRDGFLKKNPDFIPKWIAGNLFCCVKIVCEALKLKVSI